LILWSQKCLVNDSLIFL